MLRTGKFEFSLSKKNNIVIVSIVGALNILTLPEFEKCVHDVSLEAEAHFIALDLSKLQNITLDAAHAFIHLQRILRDRGQAFRISGLEESLREKLTNLGIIRYSELAGSLRDSLLIALPRSDGSKKAS